MTYVPQDSNKVLEHAMKQHLGSNSHMNRGCLKQYDVIVSGSTTLAKSVLQEISALEKKSDFEHV